MAVRTNDIALRGFLEDAGTSAQPCLAQQELLRRRIAMIELHDEWRKGARAVQARTVAKREQKRSSSGFERCTLADAAWRVDQSARCPSCSLPFGLKCVGSDRVAVGTDHITLRDLGEQSIARREHRLGPREAEGFCRWIAVVEVHLVRRESQAAVSAGHPAQVPQELERRALPRHHPVDLFPAIAAVVLDVVGPLAGPFGHRPTISNRWSRVNRTRFGEGTGSRATATPHPRRPEFR
jgi:hypothetical protein